MSGFVRNRGGTRMANGAYRGGSWTAYWDDYGDGTRRQRSKGGFKTKAEAQAHLAIVSSSKQDATYVAPAKGTFGEYLLEAWLPAQRQRLRESSYEDYRRRIVRNIIPALGGVPLQALTAVQLDRFYADLLLDGSARGGGMSPKSVRNVHVVIRKALADATRKRLVARNVAVDADAPRIASAADSEMEAWNPDELRQFLDGIREHELAPAYVLAAATGMRRGEVLGIRWKDVDLDRQTVSIRQTVLSVGYRILLGEPKTARGRRTISLDSATAAVLRAHRASQQRRRADLGLSHAAADDLVFCRADGSPVHPDLFSKTFERKVRQLGLRRVRLHDLRHTYATLALQAGVDAKTVSSRLGHSTVAFTLDVYTKAVPQLDRDAADQVADLIFKGDEGAEEE